ncbi:MAG: universal stress protein [Rhodococcus sp. (in: high G+C Gram-positive bacteria)]
MTVAVVASTSPEGREALNRGAAEAALRNEPLVVLAVVDSDSITQSHRETAQAESREVLGEKEFQLQVEPDGGDAAGAIVDLVADVGADLVVIGSRRRSAVGKFLTGSTVQRVLLDSPVPVLVVKAAER